MLDFINFSFIDVLDILLVGLLIFWMIRLIRGTSAVSIFYGIILMYLVWIVARALKMKLLSFILGQVLGVGVVALIVIFQPEIRRFLLRLSAKPSAVSNGILRRFFKDDKIPEGMTAESLEELTAACRKMSETRTGALIVLQHNSDLSQYIETGDLLQARINRRLIENIFFKNTPLHDGAMIIDRSLIISARCTLPISDSMDIDPRYGMRHRAAVGISESTDASVIVVSEETGEITFVQREDKLDAKNRVSMDTINSISELRLKIEKSFR
ncbi:MAG: diadenylate cyclase CdaA [Bacteroidales bacterium]|nr:diadenylate cyclase CdaA [Candidatus Cacconaster merdequi]